MGRISLLHFNGIRRKMDFPPIQSIAFIATVMVFSGWEQKMDLIALTAAITPSIVMMQTKKTV
ncbi:hypothetical protein D3C73_497720 [compost metagenome]